MKYHVITLGCQMNISDSNRLRNYFDSLGYKWVDKEEDAELIGILACSVRQKAIDKVYSRISKWNKWKNNKNLITFLTGCVLPADRVKFLKLFDIVFYMSDLPEWENLLKHYGITTAESYMRNKSLYAEKMKRFWDIKPEYSSDFEAFVPIQNGCDKFCTYCAVPFTRGREVSRPSADVLYEVENLIKNGYKSITLLGQNVNSYGIDKKGQELTFAQLLDKIGQLGNKYGNRFWLYYTSPHPRDMGTDVVEVMAKYDAIAKQVHLPLQAGDDFVLKRMNRQYTLDDFRQKIINIKEKMPNVSLFTDIIVGFSGETQEMFEKTRQALNEFEFNMAYIAMYSVRPGSAAAKWPDNVSVEEKKRRFHILSDDLKKISYRLNNEMIGKTFKILVTGLDRKPGFLSGHTEGKIIARFKTDKNIIGKFVNVKITSAQEFSVEGELTEILD